jgi:hypothetical protein
MNRRSLPLHALAGILLALALPVAAQPKGAPKPVPVDVKTAYDLAKAAAAKWQPDAVLFGFSNLVTGPVDAEGRSTAWVVKFSSKAAGKTNNVSVTNGVVTTWEMDGAGGRVIPVKAETTWDSKELVRRADEAGGAAHRAGGAKATLGLVANTVKPGTTLWHVSYQDAKYKELFHVAVEGETGTLKVLKN